MASTGTLSLVGGIALATVLSAAAVFAVAQSGCDDPGTYRERDGVVELIGGCVQAEDLPVTPAPQLGDAPHSPPADIDPSIAP
ncbi:hypothetical protein BJ969_000418 [Saccharopolyspora gloriosae]|uniref:DUF2613 family protein n=1 Tax=Saccharopolyspora gloriosae TaxID=455344 RepID=A0A840N5R6_9PSEU|nr:hypothetical protein [Saccharopolyspora gloriosae]MBB5067330.1 hypothetical protein [Saccharopolyspora gloriosae]